MCNNAKAAKDEEAAISERFPGEGNAASLCREPPLTHGYFRLD